MSELRITRRNGETFIQPRRQPGRYYVLATVRDEAGVERSLYLHQLLCGKWADHINGDSLDNRRRNLRPATAAENAANRPATRDGYKGITFHKQAGKWQASIAKRYLGLFDTAEEAAAAYDAAARERWGEFAQLNGAAS